jgi:excisionase family DNA binding protein
LKAGVLANLGQVGATSIMRLIQAKRASEVLSVSLARLYELARLGIIPVVRLGPRQIRFDEEALNEWVKQGGLPNEGNGSEQMSELTRGRSGFAQT